MTLPRRTASRPRTSRPPRPARPRRLRPSVAGLLAGALLASCVQAAGLTFALATTVENAGLAEVLTSAYGAECDCELRPLAVGSTQALAYLERGEVELAITHAPGLEHEYLQRHPGSERYELMMSEFILAGPPADPAGVRGLDLTAALRRVAQQEGLFLSRADGSGTNRAERRLWVEAQDDVPAEEGWYRAASVSMAKLLLVAAQQRAYAISDSATLAYLQERQDLQLEVLAQDRPPRANVYSVLLRPDASPAAREFAAWLLSDPAQALIRAYRIAGAPAFRPVAP